MDKSKKKNNSIKKIPTSPKSENTQVNLVNTPNPTPNNVVSSNKRKRNRKKSSKNAKKTDSDIKEIDTDIKPESLNILETNTTVDVNSDKITSDLSEPIIDTNSKENETVQPINIITNVSKTPLVPSITEIVVTQSNIINNQINLVTKNMEEKPVEKSRDEIKAEREAKKLAKQLAKTKKKDQDGPKTVDAVVKREVPKDVTNKPTITNIANVGKDDIKENKVEPKVPKVESKVQKVESKVPKVESIVQKVESKEKKVTINDNQIATVEELPTNAQEKSKSELRAERRAKQEAQRAAKAQNIDKTNVTNDKKKTPLESKKATGIEKIKSSLTDDAKIEMKKSVTADKLKLKAIQNRHKVKLFNHLYTEEDNKFNITLNSKNIPPVIVRLGVQYASHIIVGSNARCIALLSALRKVIKEYVVPPNVEFSRDLEAHFDNCMKFLNSCRPLAVSMVNAVKYVKSKLRNLPLNIEENDAKSILEEYIDTYINEQIEVAGRAISISVNEKITNGDVILTYGCSSLIEKILVDAASHANKTFSVVVVAANPWDEGREMLRRLTAKNVNCSFVMISALSFVMRKINKVILGAGALLANGYVMARAGTAQVAMVARAYNVPVLVCCETHKFSERAQTDSFVYNEIGDPDDLIKCNTSEANNPISNWRAISTLTPLNLTYDVTPPDLVTAVVTELAVLPCTSVPVVLRIKPNEAGM